jgi:hypothetical protein
LNLKQMGMPIPDDFIVDASSIARKEELKLALEQARQVQAMLPQQAPPGVSGSGGGSGPGGSAVGKDGGSMPANVKEPGAPMPR